MKKILSLFPILTISLSMFAQCTEELAAKLPFSSVQSNAYKYIGTNGKENKTNTDSMYNKMMAIYTLFNDAFKSSTGMICKWKAQVDNKNNEGLVKGYMEIYLQQVTCKDNGEFNKNSGNIPIEIDLFINGFEPWIVRDEKKHLALLPPTKKIRSTGI